ncbi:MAG: glycosyltransferase family 39 protein [Deltaproteobacteria bacterium]|nr:glycosyltransferase family 39 protein [Deltaproteobacteria bacterium]
MTGGTARVRFAIAFGVCLAATGALFWVGTPSPMLLAWAAFSAAILVLQPRFAPALLAVNAGFVAWIGHLFAPMYLGRNFDTWMHLTIVRRVVENGPFPPDPFYAGHSAAPLVSVIHHVYAAAAWLTELPIGQLWFWGIPLVAALTAAAAYFFHRELLGDSTAAFFAAMFYLVSRYFEWPTANYPRVVAPTFLLLSLALMLRGLRLDSRRLFVMAGLALGLAIAAHPIAGLMSAMVVGGVLLGEWLLEWRSGRGRSFTPLLLAVAGGAAIAAGPWIVCDFVALLNKGETAPLLQNAEGVAEDLAFFLKRDMQRILRAGAHTGDQGIRWVVLWGLPVLAGIARLFTVSCARRIRVYVTAAVAVVLVVMWSPLTPFFLEWFTPRYAARFIYALPIPALAGFGLAWMSRYRIGSGPRLAAAAVFSLYAALLLRSMDPRTAPELAPLSEKLTRPELEKIEPLIRDRVVLAARSIAYELPYFTGAFVTWNPQGHSNPWAWDRERIHGSLRILKGKSTPNTIRAFCDLNDVEFALLPIDAEEAIAPLKATGEFEQRAEIPGYVLLERQVR